MRSLRPLLSTSIALLTLTAPALAAASPTYPGLIVMQLGLNYSLGTPDCLSNPTSACHCTICHTSNTGGVGTAVQPFGTAMRQAGLHLENPPELMAALDTLQQDGTITNPDCVPDIQEIIDGRDPNTGACINPAGCGADGGADGGTADGGASCGASAGPSVAYGCGAQIAGAPASWPDATAWPGVASFAMALGLALAARLRRRR